MESTPDHDSLAFVSCKTILLSTLREDIQHLSCFIMDTICHHQTKSIPTNMAEPNRKTAQP